MSGRLCIALVLYDLRGVRNGDRRAVAARREQLLECRIRRRHLDPRTAIGAIGNFEDAAHEPGAVVAVGQNGNLLFLQLRKRLDFLAARTDQQQHVMFQDGKGAGAGRDPCIGAQHREIGLPAIERRERPGTIGVGHDLEAQPRRVGLEYCGKLGGETGLKAVGVPDGEDQRFGIFQPDAAAPNRRNR